MKQLKFISIKRQIIILFLIISLLMILLGVLNFMSLKHYQKSIRYLRESSIEQLALLNKIQFNTGNIYINLLHNFYAIEPEKKLYYADGVNELIGENDIFFIELSKKISKTRTRDSLDQVLNWRKIFIVKVKTALETSWKEQDVLPFEYEEKEIRPLARIYKQKLENFSKLVILNAEQDVAITLDRINDTRILSRLIVVLGILFLFIISLFIIKITKRLNEDYLSLKLQTTEREKAQKELQLLNEELESKVNERTAELKGAYKNICNYNDELKELTEAKDKFISVISHDLRNPITTILSSSEILKDMLNEAQVNEEVKNFAEIINRSTNKLITQLNELVNWAKIKSTSKIFHPVRLNLKDAGTESFKLIESNAEEKNITLINEIPNNLFVNADKLMLRSIFQNLVTNSIKFTEKGGTVILNAAEINGFLEILITDTGIGMPADVKENLFKESTAVSGTGTAKEYGSGLGLILVKDFVERHGGKINVESEPGKGSTFIFTIPKAINNFE